MTRYDETGFEPLTDVSIDDFGAVTEPHEFSANYQARKAALLGEYRAQCASDAQREAAYVSPARSHAKARPQRKRSFGWKFAIAAAAAALVALPAAGFAVANNADFFANAFGTGARASIAEHQETVDQGGKTVAITYPAREYVDMDPEEAERLLGDHLVTTPVEVVAGDHKITVLSAVRDDNSAVVHYTVSREGGVTALEYNRLSNEGKGAYIKNDNPYYWTFTTEAADGTCRQLNFGFGFTFVNTQRTTDDTVDCYDYLTFPHGIAEGSGITLSAFASADESPEPTPTDFAEIPVTNPLPSTQFICDTGATVTVSAIGERLDGYEKVAVRDGEPHPDFVSSETIAFNDGSDYLMYDFANNVDNTCYTLGGEEAFFTIFNRLVNPDAIAKITINGFDFVR